jgi:hypothetical protein
MQERLESYNKPELDPETERALAKYVERRKGLGVVSQK